MTITSYRLYCEECDRDEVIREEDLDDSPWKVVSVPHHEGLCPVCNDAVDVDSLEGDEEYDEKVDLTNLDHIGEKAANNLRRNGYDTIKSIVDASDEEILDVSWVGEKGLFLLKEAARAHPPQQRWDE